MFRFYTPWNPFFFWCFQGEKKLNIGLKHIKNTLWDQIFRVKTSLDLL